MFARLSRFLPELQIKLPNLMAWYEIGRERHHLGQLSEKELNDIGLTKQDVALEVRRPVWDAPGHWTN